MAGDVLSPRASPNGSTRLYEGHLLAVVEVGARRHKRTVASVTLLGKAALVVVFIWLARQCSISIPISYPPRSAGVHLNETVGIEQ